MESICSIHTAGLTTVGTKVFGRGFVDYDVDLCHMSSPFITNLA